MQVEEKRSSKEQASRKCFWDEMWEVIEEEDLAERIAAGKDGTIPSFQ